MQLAWIKIIALTVLVGTAGCTRTVIVPPDPNFPRSDLQSEDVVSHSAGGATVCTQIDPTTGTCPPWAWAPAE